jgi:glycerol-3-phosphate acyltransferase PlsY
MIDWPMALISLGVFVIVIALSRFVSLGTISAAVVFVALSFVPAFGATYYFSLFAFAIALIIILKHRQNIERLLAGTENKLKF